jgi:hypothetical protein
MMKYKTLFRLALKAIGVLIFVEAISALTYAIPSLVLTVFDTSGSAVFLGGMSRTIYLSIINPLLKAAIGVYLFFRGEWIVNLAIPGNRPYCPECAYDLSGAVEPRCPECGTAFRWEEVMPKCEIQSSKIEEQR